MAEAHISLKDLINLRHQVLRITSDPTKKLKRVGEKFTRTRGRGIEFAATREYQAGDDIRNMAWRVTARSLKPHIKVYHEEKERPVWLAVDLSPSQYFGTRSMFKSVRSIIQTATLGWTHLLKRERIGAIIATSSKMQIYKPKLCERNFLRILNTLADASSIQPFFSENNYLRDLLLALRQQARSDNLIFILSDFFHFNDEIQKIILQIASLAQVVLIFVYDVFEAFPPPPHHYVLTNGEESVSFNMTQKKNRLLYQQQFQEKQNSLIQFCRKYNINLQIVATNQEGIHYK